MKKILTIAAVAILAVASQATTVSWSSGTMYNAVDKNGTWGTDSTDKAKGTVDATFFLVSESVYKSFTDAKSIYDAFKGDGFVYTATSGKITSNNGGISQWKSTKDYNVGDKDYCIAVFEHSSADYGDFYIASKAAIEMTAGGASPTDFKVMASSVGEWQNVPEPTSLALIALGVAAFGLKRKHA